MIVDQFEEMIERSTQNSLVMSVSLHPYICGQPFRMRPLRQALRHCVDHVASKNVWFTKASEICDYYRCLDFSI